jgi:hypothetical protein
MTPHGEEIALEGGESLEPSETESLRMALGAVFGRGSPVRRVSVYLVARDRAIVRLVVGQGWIPVIVELREFHDAAVLAVRLAQALDAAQTSFAAPRKRAAKNSTRLDKSPRT